MGASDAITLATYGLIVVLTALGGIFGPRAVLLVAAALAVLWVVILLGHRRDASEPGD